MHALYSEMEDILTGVMSKCAAWMEAKLETAWSTITTHYAIESIREEITEDKLNATALRILEECDSRGSIRMAHQVIVTPKSYTFNTWSYGYPHDCGTNDASSCLQFTANHNANIFIYRYPIGVLTKNSQQWLKNNKRTILGVLDNAKQMCSQQFCDMETIFTMINDEINLTNSSLYSHVLLLGNRMFFDSKCAIPIGLAIARTGNAIEPKAMIEDLNAYFTGCEKIQVHFFL